MKNYSIALCLLLFPILAFTQKINFSVSGRVGSTLSEEGEKFSERLVGLHTLHYNDSMAIIKHDDVTYDTRSTYAPRVTYELEGNVNYSITKTTYLQGTIGFNSLNIKETHEFTNREVVSTFDTVSANSFTQFSLVCDKYLNEEVLEGFEKSDHYKSLNLTFSLNIRQAIPRTKLFLKTGVNLQIPVFNQIVQNYITVIEDKASTENVCIYSTNQFSTTNNNSIKKLQLGYHVGVEYKFSERLGLSLNYYQNTSSLMKNSSSFFRTDEFRHFRPTRITCGVNFYIT